jgi:hypothetical protein
MKGNLEVPEGFEISPIESYKIDGDDPMTTVLGLSDKRALELVKIIKSAFERASIRKGKHSGTTHAVPALIEITKQCHTPIELALATYAFGCYVTQGTGGGRGPKMAIVHIQIGKGGEGGIMEEEVDPIEALIKKSYEINKDKEEEG